MREHTLIQDWKKITDNHIKRIGQLIVDMLDLHREYVKIEKTDIGFNIFTLCSDKYYRENFHSDIIKAFLDPREKHNEGNKYLHIFIDLLNGVNNQNHIKKSDFENTSVEREKHHIDICVIDDVSKKAIIIENKINNAVDQHRQLPKYYDKLKGDYEVVAIVYLTLNNSKQPDKSDWTKEEGESIDKILKLIPAWSADNSKSNLLDNWVSQSIINSENADSLLLLKQYGKLLKHLNTNSMDTTILKKFHEQLMEGDNYETAISIRTMLNYLPKYLAIRIKEKYEAKGFSPFEGIWIYEPKASIATVFEGFKFKESSFALDIYCQEDKYDVSFFQRNVDEEFDLKEFQEKIDVLSCFSFTNNRLRWSFKVKEEGLLYDFIDSLLEELKQMK